MGLWYGAKKVVWALFLGLGYGIFAASANVLPHEEQGKGEVWHL
jgi:hypothetical protein